MINWKDASGLIPVDRNTVGIHPRTTTQVLTGTGPSVPPIRIGIQKIEGPRRSIIPQGVRNAETLDASINRFMAKHRDPTPGWSTIIGSKVVTDKSFEVYARRRMNFSRDTFFSENPNFMDFGLSPVNTRDKLGSVIVSTTRVGMLTNGSDWLQHGKDNEEATSDRVSKTKAITHYNFRSDFETMREIQYFERENISMSQPNFDSTPIVTNTTNRTTSPIDSISVGTKITETTPLTQPTEFP